MEAEFADVPHELWDLAQPLMPPEKPRLCGGRPPIERRVILAGITYRLPTDDRAAWLRVAYAVFGDFGLGASASRSPPPMPATYLTSFLRDSTSYWVVMAICSMMGEPPP
jgi:hypothetical protein